MEVNCRICGLRVERTAWWKHMYAHKLEYCRRTGRPETYAELVNWYDVVSYFCGSETGNPKSVAGQMKLSGW